MGLAGIAISFQRAVVRTARTAAFAICHMKKGNRAGKKSGNAERLGWLSMEPLAWMRKTILRVKRVAPSLSV